MGPLSAIGVLLPWCQASKGKGANFGLMQCSERRRRQARASIKAPFRRKRSIRLLALEHESLFRCSLQLIELSAETWQVHQRMWIASLARL